MCSNHELWKDDGMITTLIVGLKVTAFVAYMLFEHFLGKTTYGSFIGMVLSFLIKEE